MLIIFGGLPGTGKTAIARELARQIGAAYLRIDSVEQAIRNSRLTERALDDSGYRVCYAVAEDNLRLGRTVIADSVNPIRLTRDAWMAVAERAKVRALEVEVICSDSAQHQHRVETRITDIADLPLPRWKEVLRREYEPWQRDHVIVDTASQSVAESVRQIRDALRE